MIVAIEGGSAGGKTTWCRSYAPHNHVPEAPPDIAAPDLFADPTEVAQFWVKHAISRWQQALELEYRHGIAFCDGDPLKLYYSWSLWKAGVLGRELFDRDAGFSRLAFEERQIGFVDHVLWLEVSEDELRRRASADSTRRRRRHEMNLAVLPWMRRWFEGRERVLPGMLHRLTSEFDVHTLHNLTPAQRYNVDVFDETLTNAGR